MPSILELSHELVKRTRRPPTSEPTAQDGNTSAIAALEARIAGLEENERRQAELVTNMAEQLEQLTTAVAALHRRWRLLIAGQITAGVIAVIALVLAVR
jgi:primosomal protein N''